MYSPDQPRAADPLASQRAELLGRLVGAQFDLERALGELIRSGTSTAIAQNELHALSQLQRQIGRADPAALATLSGTVAAAIASAQDVSRQAATAASGNDPDAANTLLAVASAKARAAVQEDMRDIYGRKIFDPYLRFASAEDEAAYRRREEETHRAIEKALAEHTPEGDLRAAKLMRGQLLDAKEHGADASPAFAGIWERNERGNTDLENAMRSATPSPTKTGASPNGAASSESSTSIANEDMTAALAGLRAAGIVGGTATDQSGHGLSVAATVSAKPRALG